MARLFFFLNRSSPLHGREAVEAVEIRIVIIGGVDYIFHQTVFRLSLFPACFQISRTRFFRSRSFSTFIGFLADTKRVHRDGAFLV